MLYSFFMLASCFTITAMEQTTNYDLQQLKCELSRIEHLSQQEQEAASNKIAALNPTSLKDLTVHALIPNQFDTYTDTETESVNEIDYKVMLFGRAYNELKTMPIFAIGSELEELRLNTGAEIPVDQHTVVKKMCWLQKTATAYLLFNRVNRFWDDSVRTYRTITHLSLCKALINTHEKCFSLEEIESSNLSNPIVDANFNQTQDKLTIKYSSGYKEITL